MDSEYFNIRMSDLKSYQAERDTFSFCFFPSGSNSLLYIPYNHHMIYGIMFIIRYYHGKSMSIYIVIIL